MQRQFKVLYQTHFTSAPTKMKTVLSQYAFAIVVLLIQDTIICQNNNLRPNINPPSPVVMAPPAGNAPPPPAPANQVNAQNPSVPLNNNNGNGLPVRNANQNANIPVNNLRTNNNNPQNAVPNSSPNLSGNNGGVSNNNGLGNNHGGANTGILPNNANSNLNHAKLNGNGMNSKNATSFNAVPGAKKGNTHLYIMHGIPSYKLTGFTFAWENIILFIIYS